MSVDNLRVHQMVLLSMLKEVDRICKKYDIKYMLFAGTALGAIRHQGFIPWDDDLDIIMVRSEYERFLENAVKELDLKMYFLQKEFSEHWPCPFSKLRKNNTAYIEKTIPRDKKQHQGIYIDIFPCDNLSDIKVVKKLQFYMSKIIIANGLSKRGYLTNSRIKKMFMSISNKLPINTFFKIVKLEKKNDTNYLHTFFAASSKYGKSVFKREWFEDTIRMKFEDEEFPVSIYFDEMLTTMYGNYMKIPSEEERECKVHALKIDFENSYENYISWQESQKIDIYTRSIR